MKYTNKLNLPQSIVDSFTESDTPIKNRYSVTEILKSNKEILLTRKYWNNIEVDVSECINMLFGTAVHKILEENTLFFRPTPFYECIILLEMLFL